MRKVINVSMPMVMFNLVSCLFIIINLLLKIFSKKLLVSKLSQASIIFKYRIEISAYFISSFSDC